MLISFPFRLDAAGNVAARDDDTEDYMAEELAQMIRTHPGERELVPTYGINDPAYAEFDHAMLAAQVSTFGPPVRIDGVNVQVLDDTEQDVVISFSVTHDAGFGAGVPVRDTTLVSVDDDDTRFEEFEG